MRPRWADRFLEKGVLAFARRLGRRVDVEARRAGYCPVCRATDSVEVLLNDERWLCSASPCEAAGDALDLLSLELIGSHWEDASPDALRQVQRAAADDRSNDAPPPAPSVARSLGSELLVTDDAQLADLEQGSAISRDVIVAAGLFTCSNPRELNKMLGAKWKWSEAHHLPALVIPYRTYASPDSVLFQVKPRTPFVINHAAGNTSEHKYVRTRGALAPYLPPSIVLKPEVLDDPARPLFLVEGEKKTLALAAAGFLAVGLSGVDCWGHKPRRNAKKKLFPELERAARAGRDLFLVYDSDRDRNILGVRRAEQELAQALTDAGAKRVYILRLPPGPPLSDGTQTKVGADDFLRDFGKSSFQAIVAEERQRGPLELERTPAPGAPGLATALTDLGNAERLEARHGRDLRYSDAVGWHVWDGQRFVADEDAETMRRAEETVRAIYAEAARADGRDATDAILDHARASEGKSRIVSMVALAGTLRSIAVRATDFDADPWLLNVRNGTVDLRSGRLLPHDRARLCTRFAPVDFDDDAKCPRFDAFLEQVLPDRDVRSFVQRQMGYAATAVVREHVMPVWYGGGSNGKSTLAELVQRVLGDYARTVSSDVFMSRRNDSSRETELFRLWRARCVFANETEQNRALNDSLVKAITGGDTIVARALYKDAFQFEPTHKLTLRTNHKPRVIGDDDGIWRRLLLVPFLVSIPEKDRDTDLKEKLWAEASGVLRWIVEGCLEWQRHGLRPPVAVVEASNEYRSDMDVIGRFLEDRCVLSQDRGRGDARTFRSRAGELFKAYSTWAEEEGERALSTSAFGRALADRGFKRGKIQGNNWYFGLGLRAPGSPLFSSDDSSPVGDGGEGGDRGERTGKLSERQMGLEEKFTSGSPVSPPSPPSPSGGGNEPLLAGPDDGYPDRGDDGDEW